MGAEYGFHPLADLFPLMGEAELKELAQDIRGPGGLRSAITLFEGKILDGRNRYLACRIACVEPRYEEWKGPGSALGWVISVNLHRRHLDESQRALIGARAKALFEEEARRRQAHGGTAPGRTLGANLPEASRRARDDAAKLVNVSPRSVEAASRVIADGTPALVRAVETGELAVSRAAKIAKVGEEDRKRAEAAKQAEAEARGRADALEAERQARIAAEAKAAAAKEQKRALEAERRKKEGRERPKPDPKDREAAERAAVAKAISHLETLWERLNPANREDLIRSLEGFIKGKAAAREEPVAAGIAERSMDDEG